MKEKTWSDVVRKQPRGAGRMPELEKGPGQELSEAGGNSGQELSETGGNLSQDQSKMCGEFLIYPPCLKMILNNREMSCLMCEWCSSGMNVGYDPITGKIYRWMCNKCCLYVSHHEHFKCPNKGAVNGCIGKVYVDTIGNHQKYCMFCAKLASGGQYHRYGEKRRCARYIN